MTQSHEQHGIDSTTTEDSEYHIIKHIRTCMDLEITVEVLFHKQGNYTPVHRDMFRNIFHSLTFKTIHAWTCIPFLTKSVYGTLLGISILIPGSAQMWQKKLQKLDQILNINNLGVQSCYKCKSIMLTLFIFMENLHGNSFKSYKKKVFIKLQLGGVTTVAILR